MAPRAWAAPPAAHPPSWQWWAAPRHRWGRTSCPRRSRGQQQRHRPARLCRQSCRHGLSHEERRSWCPAAPVYTSSSSVHQQQSWLPAQPSWGSGHGWRLWERMNPTTHSAIEGQEVRALPHPWEPGSPWPLPQGGCSPGQATHPCSCCSVPRPQSCRSAGPPWSPATLCVSSMLPWQ